MEQTRTKSKIVEKNLTLSIVTLNVRLNIMIKRQRLTMDFKSLKMYAYNCPTLNMKA